MARPRHVAVIDIGKTNAKLALVDLEAQAEFAAWRTPNRPRRDGPYPHHDVDATWQFLLDGLAELRRDHAVDAISVTTHGATAALTDAGGGLALPVLDYEFGGPESMRDAYEAIRPPFAETGSPPLPLGLNVGAQLFWQSLAFPDAFARAKSILTYPQYWTFRLTGRMASEATSLGCHTDLWNPYRRDFSPLVDSMGWRGLFPPLAAAGAVLGPLLPEIARRAGLDPATPVLCGIHDSNASLLPHLAVRKAPFAVVSTGTWVVALAVGGDAVPLDPGRDTLVNVNAFGDPVPSARFMGGREFERIAGAAGKDWTEDDMQAVLSGNVMLLPSIQHGSGPFPRRTAGWTGPAPVGGCLFVAASFYLAAMTATCLELVGARGEVVVEGPLAGNRPYLSMLASAVGRPVFAEAGRSTGTSIGAALLAAGPGGTATADSANGIEPSPILASYAELWRSRVADAGGQDQRRVLDAS